jgi:hypothetical protein
VDWLSLRHSRLTLKSPPHFRELEDSVSDFRVVFTPIQQPTIITLTGTTCDRITIILSRIRTVTAPGTMAIELITAPTAITIATTINPAVWNCFWWCCFRRR